MNPSDVTPRVQGCQDARRPYQKENTTPRVFQPGWAMAPPDMSVHSGGDISITDSRYASSPLGQPFRAPPICSGHTGELMPLCESSTLELKSELYWSSPRTTGQKHAIQACISMAYGIPSENLLIRSISARMGTSTANMALPITRLMSKTEPDMGSPSSPLLKSLSAVAQVTKKPSHKSEHSQEFVVKAEPESEPVRHIHKGAQANVLIPAVCSVEKLRYEHVSPKPAVDDSPPLLDNHGATFSKEHYTNIEATADHPLSFPTHSCLLGISRLQVQGVLCPSLDPRPPEDISYNAPKHQDAHESLNLYKSLFGLAQCLTSQRGASILSPGSIHASNSPVSSQTQYNSNPTLGSSTTGSVNNAEQNIEQNAKCSLEEAIINTELANLDANSLMELGNFFYRLAFQRDPSIADLGLSHDYVPDSYAFPSEVPVPLPSHLNNPSASETFVRTTYLSTSDDKLQPITHASTSFSINPSSTHLHSSVRLPPYFNPSELPTTALPNNSNTVHNIAPCTAADEPNKALHVCSECGHVIHGDGKASKRQR
ncbi:hypothetical protein AG1IA_06251 [Rhizoctonia solani AG-1 IA]|uniref:Uncharacterized protein n=1 Tax=Thanatephorus cucumeris (strain AG1-IA) TaxID=983506 RepID=L8WSK5_THACA|nr:hypothetical protein AG1IA_06251 [Rhizoctonia solani AG-1 IA]